MKILTERASPTLSIVAATLFAATATPTNFQLQLKAGLVGSFWCLRELISISLNTGNFWMITRNDLARLCPRPGKPGAAQTNWDGYVAVLTSPEGAALFRDHGVDTAEDLCGFIANAAQETGDAGGFTCLWENMNFTTVAAVRGAWRVRASQVSDAWIKANLLRKPEALAEWAYAGRMGNGRGNGDAYRYRGFGILQITGKTDHIRYLKGEHTYLSALRAALNEWHDKACGDHCNAGEFEAACILINGGRNGLAERKAYFAKAQKIWTDVPDWSLADTPPFEIPSAPVAAAVAPLAGPVVPVEAEKPTARIKVETAIQLAQTSRKWFLSRILQWKGSLFAGLGLVGLSEDDPLSAARQGQALWLEFGLVGCVILGVGCVLIGRSLKTRMVKDNIEGRAVASGELANA